MYIKKIVDKNIGPISEANIEFSFDNYNNPKPTIFVGENGSGKTTIISNIVDAFYEFAGKAFNDVFHMERNGNSYSYFKIISGSQIKIGQEGLFSYVKFDNNWDYVFKSGSSNYADFRCKTGIDRKIDSWDNKVNIKSISNINEELLKKEFNENVICYLGPERYEKPEWMGESYYDDINTHIFVRPKFEGRIINPIMAYNIGKDNFRWLLDVIVDSRTDIENTKRGIQFVHADTQNLMAMQVARNNIEKVMSTILGEEVYFGLNLRSEGGARFNIKRKLNDTIITPALDALSSGQLALFNMFVTIIRYADNNDINKSINISDIVGIVVIDEIELHLHTSLQKKVLPRLIKLFPKVQFIITTHSPLFLIGMRDEFGESNMDIYQMPNGIKTDVEGFSEFERAYDYFSLTERHRKEIFTIINKSLSEKPLVITEGPTDWKHMKAAFDRLKNMPEYHDILSTMDFEYFEYAPKNARKENVLYHVEMGNTNLCNICEACSKFPQRRKMIFIADRDNDSTNKKLEEKGMQYKCWGNNVYSFILPVPDSRAQTPDICIEHYYNDNEIKTEYKIEGIGRRLFMGNEFDKLGISRDNQMVCEKKSLCGDDKISIIDGSFGEKVIKIAGNRNINYGLSKMIFANNVLDKVDKFDNFDVKNFMLIFEIIAKIINEESK